MTPDVDRADVEAFLYREARLADEHEYDAWEALWTDDAVYWVPAEHDDPDGHVSIVHDNRHRIATRVKQLATGRRYAQAPASRLRRVVSNVELDGRVGGGGADAQDVVVHANFVLLEAREQGSRTWGGRVTYHLRPAEGGWRMSYKAVDLVDRPFAVPTLAFLI